MAWQDALPWNIVSSIARGIGRAYPSPERPDPNEDIINPQTTGLATKTPLGDFIREGFNPSPASRNASMAEINARLNPAPAEPLIARNLVPGNAVASTEPITQPGITPTSGADPYAGMDIYGIERAKEFLKNKGTPAPSPDAIYPTDHHPSKYPEAKDRYDWAEKIPDKVFKEFIDKHDDTSPHVKGLGYIETIDPVTKKPRFEKVISRPESGGESPTMQDMNPAQLTALSHAITGIGGIGQTAANAKEGHDIERKKLEHLIAQSDIKNPDARVKLLRDIAISGGEKRYILDEDKIKIGEQTVPDYEGAAAIIKAVTGHDLSSSIPKKKVQSALIPPTAAIEFLKKNPKTAANFDEKFGAGASQRYLGG
jgi:hypothetical protein